MSRRSFSSFRACWVLVIGLISTTLAGRPALAQTTSDPSYWFRVLLPPNLVPSQIGHASFRLGSNDILIFAADLPVELGALQEITKIQTAAVHHLPNATILTIPLPAGQVLNVVPAQNSFHVVLGKLQGTKAINPSYAHGHIVFPTAAPGAVITVALPDRSEPLLVGTVMNNAALGLDLQGPGYATIPAVSGVVVAASSDDLAMSADHAGFVLASSDPAAPLAVGNPPVSGTLTASPDHIGGLDLPHGTIQALRARMEQAQRRVAAAPPLARRAQSLRLARVLLSLGLGPEAEGVLVDMLRSDPAAADDPQRLALLAVASVLAHRPLPHAAATSPPALATPTDRLWRGLARAEQGDVIKAAPMITPGLPRLIAAPVLLRHEVAPLTAETLIAAGDVAPAKTLLEAMPHDRNLALARAELRESEHHPHAALRAYHALLDSPDQRTAGIARYRWIMLRVQLHQIDARTAAASLGRHVYEWRAPRHELNVRIAMARLSATAGQWPQAFADLGRASHLFPGQTSKILSVRQELFKEMIASHALKTLSPLAAVTVINENLDLVPPGDAGVPILGILSDRLIALGLPDQAAGVLRQLIAHSSDDETRAHAGYVLAGLELTAHHLAKAQAALTATEFPDISAPLASSRALLATEIAARDGAGPDLTSLTRSPDPSAVRVATQVAAKRHDWPALEQAERKLAAVTVPATGPLDHKQAQTILQWAVAASHLKDGSTLAQLRQAYQSRLPAGRAADLFATITGSPLPAQTGLSQALAQIAAIERVGATVAAKPHAVKPPGKSAGQSEK
ncbi:hypothetical protein AruPA_10315 [Acidiphilium sp. PA]|uniref:hypothetical protein n=1 Tax=Acidiphilium sp. PA TaxID=2871705 RepID=UPI002244D4C7|nr:hypothetical protein [Acidiphilium sp. PA]MCW8307430.1 hypothetical protein [Acidiphilium sp. PA]